MLFLFRNIRRKLLTSNKVTTYLLYAIGEIFLVVVGILIAVSIDEFYKRKEYEENTIANLQKIEKELSKNISEAKAFIEDSKRRDSLAQVIIDGKASIQDLKNNWRLQVINLGYNTFEFDRSYYDNLIKYPDQISERWQSTVEQLDELYKRSKNITNQEILVAECVDDYSKYLALNSDWFYQLREPPRHLLEYMINSPIHKNNVSLFQIILSNYTLAVDTFRVSAINVQRELETNLYDHTPILLNND